MGYRDRPQTRNLHSASVPVVESRQRIGGTLSIACAQVAPRQTVSVEGIQGKFVNIHSPPEEQKNRKRHNREQDQHTPGVLRNGTIQGGFGGRRDGHRKQHQQPEHKNWRPCFRQQIQLNIARGRLSPLSTDERWYDLLVILDDATSEIYYAQLVEEEIHADGDGGAEGSDRAAGRVLRLV